MEKNIRKIFVIGASGMLGNSIMRFFSESDEFVTIGTVRTENKKLLLPTQLHANIISGVDINDIENLKNLFLKIKPDFVINCIGVVKQLDHSKDALISIPINSLLPHLLARFCADVKARLVHISTDCVFSGTKGMYVESDIPDAVDLYGKSKYLGELDYSHTITLRTSMVGHELDSSRSLVGWFLSQKGTVKGYSNAIFSGLPTVEISRIIRDYILPRPQLKGVYHVSAEPINKFVFLKLVAEVYGKDIVIEEDKSLNIDRSLDSSLFRGITEYYPQPWPELIKKMYEFK